jgi:hypothetical protein
MTEFVQETRHYCRNPKCRSKLKIPVGNPREAFCAKGCYSAFYRKRCRVCEVAIEQPKNGRTRIICKKAKCISAWASKVGFGGLCDTGFQENSSRSAHFRGPEWRVIAAGAPISANHFHCATVPDDGILANSAIFTKPKWREVISPDGVRCYVAIKG